VKRIIIKIEEGHTIWMDYTEWEALKKFGDRRINIREKCKETIMEEYKQLTDEELDKAIEEIIPILQARAISFTKNKSEANDLFQETFLKIWSNKDKFTYNESLKAWCYKIMYNTLVDMFKESKKTTPLEVGFNEQRDTSYANNRGIITPDSPLLKDYNYAETNMSYEDILNTIDEVLSPTDSFIVRKLLSGYKQAEVATELGLERNNVKQHYFQAIRKVRSVLKDKFNLDEKYGSNDSLIPTHKVYRRRKLDRDIKYRKKFEQ
jgi:RNA polymerase sigma-70 factor, ECF subfamily